MEGFSSPVPCRIPSMRPTLCLLLFLSFSAHLAAQADSIAAGDAAWARRADGHQGARAIPGPVDEAIAAYERAVKEQPERLEGTWKLLRALHFKGDFTTNSNDARQKAFARGKEVAEAGIDRLAKRTAGSRQKLDAMSPAQAAKAAAGVPEAKPLYLWAAVHWGLWGDVFGRLAAARQGVGDRVKTYSETLIALDERYEDAGGHRILGRLHTLAPKVPFVTGWVDRGKAVSELRRAVALGPDNLDNHVFLAEALFEYQPAKAAEAREILRRVLARQPVPELAVEQARSLVDARALLAKHPG
jgi:tetratricopeptide (TPR) repeat protein